MTFLKVAEFIGSTIPALIAGKSNLTATFATYNEVDGYRDGFVDTKKTGLVINVQNGNRSMLGTAGNLWFMMSENRKDVNYGINAEEEASREAQLVAKDKIAKVLPALGDKEGILVVIYAGLHAFNESIESARALRKELAEAIIVVLTCDCEIRSKERVLAPLVGIGEINHVVVTPWCGGRSSMKEILDGLIASWPAPARETAQTT